MFKSAQFFLRKKTSIGHIKITLIDSLILREKIKKNHIHKETYKSNTRFAIHIEFLIFLWT